MFTARAFALLVIVVVTAGCTSRTATIAPAVSHSAAATIPAPVVTQQEAPAAALPVPSPVASSAPVVADPVPPPRIVPAAPTIAAAPTPRVTVPKPPVPAAPKVAPVVAKSLTHPAAPEVVEPVQAPLPDTAKVVAGPTSLAKPSTVVAAVAPVPAPAPSLDVAGLKSRLRDTDAIGVFTKIALKNQVDDLMEEFRRRYDAGQNADVAALREPYNLLMLKVLSLVQDDDPDLAHMLSGSREAIWGILANREKFNEAI